MSNIEIEHDHYIETRTFAGQAAGGPDVVSGEYVRRYINAAPFFNSLVSEPEKHTQHTDGSILIERMDPDGNWHMTLFTPGDDTFGAAGRCDSCGAAMDTETCPVNASHDVAVDVHPGGAS